MPGDGGDAVGGSLKTNVASQIERARGSVLRVRKRETDAYSKLEDRENYDARPTGFFLNLNPEPLYLCPET
jgi:hypothetical protein